MKILPANEARTRWREVLSDVEHHGEHYQVQRYGLPAAMIVPVAWYEKHAILSAKPRSKEHEVISSLSELEGIPAAQRIDAIADLAIRVATSTARKRIGAPPWHVSDAKHRAVREAAGTAWATRGTDPAYNYASHSDIRAYNAAIATLGRNPDYEPVAELPLISFEVTDDDIRALENSDADMAAACRAAFAGDARARLDCARVILAGRTRTAG